ncbi:unnamed protein product [Cutaneotrichosporon oleaginosum]
MRAIRSWSTLPKAELEDHDSPPTPRDSVAHDVVRARRRAARGGTPWRDMNEHDYARAEKVAELQAARVKQAEMHFKEAADRLGEVLQAHRGTQPLPPAVSEDADALDLAQAEVREAVDDMCHDLDDLDLPRFALRWLTFMEAKCYSSLTEADWDALNQRLAASLRGTEQTQYRGVLHGHLADLVYGDPALFRAVCHFAVEAAARHCWQTLLEVLFELLRFEHAALAKILFEAYKARGIVVDGIDISLAPSQIRAERLASRLKSEGMRPLVLTYVAALTLLNRWDESTSSVFIGLDMDGVMRRFTRHMDQYQVQRRVPRLGGDPKLLRRYRDNCDKLALIFYAWHADALNLHIHHLSVQSPGDTTALDKLYNDVLRASIGPNRFMIPAERPKRNASTVILPVMVWGAFACAYSRQRRADVIMRMIEVDMPARYGRVPLTALETFVPCLAVTAGKMPDLRPRIQKYLDIVWQRMLGMGAARSPNAVYNRLSALLSMGQLEGFQATVATLHASLRNAGNTLADVAVVPHLVSFHLRMQHYDEALRLIQGLARLKDMASLNLRAVRDLLKYTSYAKYPYEKRRKLVAEVLRRVDPSLVSPVSKALLMRFLLDGGNPVEAVCASLINSNAASPGYYLKVVRRLTQPRTSRRDIPLVYLEAAVHILEKHVPTDKSYAGVTYTTIWNTVVKAISMSHATEGERSELVQRAFDCFPATRETQRGHTLALMRSVIMDSLWRDDPFPALAAHWWRKLYAMDAGMHYLPEVEVAVSGFVQAGLIEPAMQVVEMCCRMSTQHGKLRSVLAERAEWTCPAFEEVLYREGITERNGEVVPHLPRFGVDYGATGWQDSPWSPEVREEFDEEAAEAEMGVGEELEELEDVD